EYRECEQALKEAEKLLRGDNLDYNESFDIAALSRLEGILSADNKAMGMLRLHREYGQRLPNVLEKLEKYKPKEKPLIIPVTDVEMFGGNWAKCVAGCKSKSLEVATAREIAELRIKHGRDSVYCANGCWAAENFNYLLDGRILVASRDYNSHFKYADEATNAHKAGKEFYLDGGVVQGLFDGTHQGKVLLLERKDVPDKISVDAFGKEPLTAFLGWNQDYGEFLNSCGIKKIELYVAGEKYAKKQKQAFSRALWAGDLDGGSALGGDYGLYDFDGRVSGVRRGEQPKAASSGVRSEAKRARSIGEQTGPWRI
ncbi:MAG: hypothetical protein V1734_00620, partial [Nanoarchaeota archaeon]